MSSGWRRCAPISGGGADPFTEHRTRGTATAGRTVPSKLARW